MSIHAKLSPSSAHRWLVCSASVGMEDGLPDSSSPYALEGTQAHTAAEILLRGDNKAIKDLLVIYAEYPDMAPFVDRYIEYVLAQPGRLFIEQRVSYHEWVDDGHGTADALVIDEDCMTVIDLKYGKGNRVDAEENPQLMLYGLGALFRYGALFDFDKIRLVVHQPRLDHVSVWETNRTDLLEWAEWVRERAELTKDPDAEFAPSDKVCQWCRAQTTCRALQEKSITVALDGFGVVRDPLRLSNAEVADTLPMIPLIRKYANALEAYALSELTSDREIPGYKLVEGRATRAWSDPKAVEKRFKNSNFKIDQFNPRKLMSPAQAEALIGKKHSIIRDFVIKPDGKPTLVPDTDKRLALDFNPTAGFKNLETIER